MLNQIKVMLVAKNTSYRRDYLEFTDISKELVVHLHTVSGQDSLSKVQKNKPDVLVLDIDEEHIDVLETLSSLEPKEMTARYVVFTTPEYDRTQVDALIYRAMSHLNETNQTTTDNVTYNLDATSHSIDRLTDRERQILDCLSEAMSTKNIARNLGIAESTVKVHIKNILKKMGLKSRIEAALWKYQHR